VKNQILNVKSYQQVVQFAADLVAPTARKQWYSLPRTDWYSFPRNEWYSLTRILQIESLLLFDKQYIGLEWEPSKMQLFVNQYCYKVTALGCFTIGVRMFRHFSFVNPTFERIRRSNEMKRRILDRNFNKNEDISPNQDNHD